MCVATPSLTHSTSATHLQHSPLNSTRRREGGRKEGWKVVVASQVANGGMLVWFSHWTESIGAQCSCGCALSHQRVRYNTYLLFLPLLSVLPSQAANTSNTHINNRRRSRKQGREQQSDICQI